MADPVYLPALPRARVLQPSYVDAGGILRGSHGGAAQPISRLGDHWAVEVNLPVMDWEADARIWVSKLLSGYINRKVAFEVFMPDFRVGTPGAVVTVDGDVVGGTSIPLKGLTPRYAFQHLQFVSVIHNSRRYLYAADGQYIAGADGKVEIGISPMLRSSLSDGDVVEVGQPIIEGSLNAEGRFSWTIDEAKKSGLSFSIEELE